MKRNYYLKLLLVLLAINLHCNGQIRVIERIVENPETTEVKTYYKTQYKGDLLFQKHCTSCHSFDERVIGAPLRDIHLIRDFDWLRTFLSNPQKLDVSDDAISRAYKAEYGSITHETNQSLSITDIENIILFIQEESDGADFDQSRLKEDYIAFEKNIDIKTGDYRYYHPNGKLSHHYIYNNGLPWKVVEVNDPFGVPVQKGTLNNGSGTLYIYDEYGNKESVTTFRNGFRNGEYKQYFDGGKIELLGFYNDGKANGTWTYFYPSGEVKNYLRYVDGRIVSNQDDTKNDKYQRGVADQRLANTASAVINTPVTSNKECVQMFPYNKALFVAEPSASDATFTALGDKFFQTMLADTFDELYLNATSNFKKYHPPVILDMYKKELSNYGKMNYYRLDKTAATTDNSIVLLTYIVTYSSIHVELNLNYIRSNGGYQLDGWSYEVVQ